MALKRQKKKKERKKEKKRYMYYKVHCSTIYNSQNMENVHRQRSGSRRCGVEYYSAIKRNEILAFLATWMDPEIIMLSEVSHTMRHQHQMLSLTCGIWKKDRLNFFAEQMLTHRHWKTYGLWRRQFGGWGDVLGLWDGNPVKLDCYDHYTTTDVINSFE